MKIGMTSSASRLPRRVRGRWLPVVALRLPLVIAGQGCAEQRQRCTINTELPHISKTPSSAGQLLAKTNVSCIYVNDRIEIQVQVQRFRGDKWIDVPTSMVRGAVGAATKNMLGIGRAGEHCVPGASYRNAGRYRIDIDGDGEGWWPWRTWDAGPATVVC